MPTRTRSVPGGPAGVFSRWTGFIGVRIAEIDQNAITHVAGDEAVETGNHARDVGMKGVDGFSQVVQIETLGDGRRPDQVDEHHAQQPALDCGHAGRDWWSARHKSAGSAAFDTEWFVGQILAAAGAALPLHRGAAVSAKPLVGRDHRATMGAYHTIALLLLEPRRGSLRIGLRSKKITA